MQEDRLYKLTLALAGIAQAASLIKELAQTGKVEESVFQASIYSLFQINVNQIADIYGGIRGIKYGLEQLVTILESAQAPLQTRYMLAMMHLQKKIFRSAKALPLLSKRIQQTQKQVDYFHLLHPTIIANLADLYLTLVGLIKFRVIIWGNQHLLSVAHNMEKIRSLLLTGVRASLLWRQVGGTRLHLIFYRKKIKKMAEKILADLDTMP